MLALFLIGVVIHKIKEYPLSPKGKGKTHFGIFYKVQTTRGIEHSHTQKICTTPDALLSSSSNPLEGPSVLNCGNVELGSTPDFQH
jgi:hypothetical protein